MVEFDAAEAAKRTDRDNTRLVIQAISAVILIFALGFHVAEVDLIGLTIIVLQTAFNGVVEEHQRQGIRGGTAFYVASGGVFWRGRCYSRSTCFTVIPMYCPCPRIFSQACFMSPTACCQPSTTMFSLPRSILVSEAGIYRWRISRAV